MNEHIIKGQLMATSCMISVTFYPMQLLLCNYEKADKTNLWRCDLFNLDCIVNERRRRKMLLCIILQNYDTHVRIIDLYTNATVQTKCYKKFIQELAMLSDLVRYYLPAAVWFCLVCWCLTTLSAQIGYIVLQAYEIYRVQGRGNT